MMLGKKFDRQKKRGSYTPPPPDLGGIKNKNLFESSVLRKNMKQTPRGEGVREGKTLTSLLSLQSLLKNPSPGANPRTPPSALKKTLLPAYPKKRKNKKKSSGDHSPPPSPTQPLKPKLPDPPFPPPLPSRHVCFFQQKIKLQCPSSPCSPHPYPHPLTEPTSRKKEKKKDQNSHSTLKKKLGKYKGKKEIRLQW